jgi:hypothetical protein
VDIGGSYSTVTGIASGNSPTGIDDAGDVTGFSTSHNSQNDSFLYSGGVYSFISLPGNSATYAYGINDSSQIVGYNYPDQATPPDVSNSCAPLTTASGQCGFLYTPAAAVAAAPEPSSALLLGAGFLAALLVLRRSAPAAR